MPSYEYQDTVTGEVYEVQQRITDKPFTHLDINKNAWLRVSIVCFDGVTPEQGAEEHFRLCPELHPVKRLIAGSTNFVLLGGGWAAQGYGA